MVHEWSINAMSGLIMVYKSSIDGFIMRMRMRPHAVGNCVLERTGAYLEATAWRLLAAKL